MNECNEAAQHSHVAEAFPFWEERQRISNQNEWTRDPESQDGPGVVQATMKTQSKRDRPMMFQLDAGLTRAAP